MSIFRHPRTTQEKRQNQDGYCRPARRPHNLPDVWDDFFKYQSRCWKNYRKTQYRIKNCRKKKDSSSYSKSMSKRDHWHFMHKWCQNRYARCNNCWKNRVWEKYDNRRERKYQKYVQEENEETRKFWKKLDEDWFNQKNIDWNGYWKNYDWNKRYE